MLNGAVDPLLDGELFWNQAAATTWDLVAEGISSNRAGEEIVVAPSAESLRQAVLARPWSSELLAPFDAALKHATQEDGVAAFAQRFAFTEGGGVSMLVIEADASPFTWHTRLRKTLLPFLKAPSPPDVLLNLEALEPALALKIFEGVVGLLTTARWEAQSYGVKSQRAARKNTARAGFRVAPPSAASASMAGPALLKLFACAQREALALNLVRSLADLPSSVLRPRSYRELVEKWAQTQPRVQVEFWGRTELAQKNAGAFLAVTQADPQDAGGILKLRYEPRAEPGATRRSPIVLVGKGVCFDTGGYNIKTSHMYGLHRDMTGSAVALACFRALVEETDQEAEAEAEASDTPIEAYLALAENLVGPDAFRPNDLVITASGKSVEVVDTDAEGRMLLCDTLHLATVGGAQLVLDFATLTGAVMRALDTRRSGVFTRDASLAALAQSVGRDTGERVWPFPLGEDYLDDLQSEVADLKQCPEGPYADHIYAASFLGEFVPADLPWVHVDLAASSNKGGLGLVESSTTGFGARWALEFIRQFQAVDSAPQP